MSHDICVLGGGMVGGTVALACARLGFKVALIDANRIKPFSPEDPPDLRVSALNMHSVEFLKKLDVWPIINSMRATPYHSLSCWEKEGYKTEFHANDIGVEYLGFFVENRLFQLALWEKCKAHENVDLIVGNRPVSIDSSEAIITLDNDVELHAKIIIAADGGNSQARAGAGIGVTGWQYSQCANLCTVEMQDDYSAQTWQQFTPAGPLAFLPMHKRYACLVWYSDQSTSDHLMSLSNAKLTTSIKKTFPDKLKNFILLDKARFNIARQHANKYYSERLVLIGDAAHTINPLAGQGVNLGLKDAAVFSEELERRELQHYSDIFKHYEQKRRPQNLIMMSAMDTIYSAFSNESKPLQLLRNFALKIADSSGPIKTQVLKYAMGLNL